MGKIVGRGRRVAALFLAFVCIFTMAGFTNSSAQSEPDGLSFTAGKYTGTGSGKNGNIEVEVEFTNTGIKGVRILNQSETEGIADGALKLIPEKIVSKQSLAIDTVAGATLTSKGILDAVESCVKQSGGSVDALKTAKETVVNVSVEEVTTDVVVVGAGAAGTSAALSARESGAKVLLLEKTASPMGAGTLAGGLFAADSQQQKDTKSTVSKKWLYDQYLDTSSGYMNSLLVRKIIDEAGKTVDWLQANGCKLNLVDAGTGNSFEHIGMPRTLHGYAEGGRVAINKLIETFKSKGGIVRFSTPATELIQDKDGKVVGVIAKKEDGSTLKVHAKAVVLATGGYGGNEEMLKQYIGKTYTVGEVASNTGDGIKMAWKAGADEYGINTTHYFWQTFKGQEIGELAKVLGDNWFALAKFSFLPNLRVNTLGQRFSDETKATLFAIHGAEIHMQPKETEYLILDTSMLETIKAKGTAGIESQFSKWKGNRQFYMEFNLPNDTDMLIKEEETPVDYAPMLESVLNKGIVFKADTLEGLAKQMGIDEKTFVESVKQYNEAKAKGEDTMFFSDTTRLVAVQKAPYYSIKYVARNLGTLGGVRINEKIEAVDEKGTAIPGLYVAGADAGGMYGKSYIDFEGGTLGFAYTSGKLAGVNAVTYCKK